MTERIYDKNGWFEIPANPLSRVGVFDYLGKSVGAEDSNAVYKVYRPAAELSRPETLNSFRLVPLVIDHAMLGKATPNSIPAEDKGVHGVIGDNVWFDSEKEMLYGNLKVFSDKAIQRTNRATIDLSLGYLAKYRKEPGVYKGQAYDYVQYDILGNHVADVGNNGRMGHEVSVLDTFNVTFDMKDCKVAVNQKWVDEMVAKFAPKKASDAGIFYAAMDEEIKKTENLTLEDVVALLKATGPKLATFDAKDDPNDDDDEWEPEFDAKGEPVMDEAGKPKMKKKVKADPNADPKDNETMDAKIKAAISATVTQMSATMDSAIAKAVAPFKAEIEQLKSAGGVKGVVTMIAERDKLAGDLSKFLGVFDHKEMTLAEVAKYGVDKLEIPSTAGQEFSSVRAWLHNRPVPTPTYGMDNRDKNGKSSVDAFIAS